MTGNLNHNPTRVIMLLEQVLVGSGLHVYTALGECMHAGMHV